jgi:hypothetical protein
MSPPFEQEAAHNEGFSKEQLMTLSNEELAQIGQVINNQRQKYESSINDYNEVVMLRQQQQQSQQEEEQQYQPQQHPPVVDMETYKERFKLPEDTNLEDDGLGGETISEEEYESSSGSTSASQEQVVDFSDDSPTPVQSQSDSLLSDEDLSADDAAL